MKKTILFTGSLFLISIIICFYACSKSGSGTNPPAATPNTVSIENFSFNSASLTVPAGTKITWTNNDNVTHTVTADDNSFSSGNLAKGATFSMTFTTAGTYSYHCQIHPMMIAKIVVQ